MINIGVIGYGYWGPNLVRNFMANPDTHVVCVCDRAPARLEKVRALYPGVKITGLPEELIADSSIDAVVIATPVSGHFDLAMAALRAGKHVFVEKPITTTSVQALQLIEEAARRKLTLLVDHTFVYTGVVRKLRELIKAPSFGQPSYFDTTRVNLGLFQQDVNVLWDLAVHDLSIMSYVLDATPVAVSATGHTHVAGQPENVAFLTVFFASDLIAHINVSWLSPVKIRKTLIGGSKQMIVYDDLETSEKLKVYDKGITVTDTPDDIHKLLISYRTGDLWSPKINDTEALQVEVSHFANCIKGLDQPLTGGEQGLEIVRILEAANVSMRNRGSPVDL
jgi:predicted dehydrogenase